MPINDQRIRKSNLGYLPSDGEKLQGYVTRLADVIKSIRYGGENVLHQEKFWCHINPRSSFCFVCDMLDMEDYILGLLQDIAQYDKKNNWICVRPKGSHDALTFHFLPKSRVKIPPE